MTEYIEREAALKIANRYGLDNGQALGRHSGIADCIASEIATIPPDTDIVRVVRCGECRYRYRVDSPYELYACRRRDTWGEFLRPKDYCSYGDRE